MKDLISTLWGKIIVSMAVILSSGAILLFSKGNIFGGIVIGCLAIGMLVLIAFISAQVNFLMAVIKAVQKHKPKYTQEIKNYR